MDWTRVEALFAEAVVLAADERAAFLDRVCGDDRALRHQVESLLAAENDAAKALIFAYEAGDVMVGQTAPARRVGLPFFDENPAHFTAAGWALFDAAVSWAIGS